MSHKTLFLQQSYIDCTNQYTALLEAPNLPLWDYVILTASNEEQAASYRTQIQYRLEHEYNARCRWEPVHLHKACWIEADSEEELERFKKRKYQYMAKDIEGRDVFLADSGYVLSMAQQDFEHVKFHFTSEF